MHSLCPSAATEHCAYQSCWPQSRCCPTCLFPFAAVKIIAMWGEAAGVPFTWLHRLSTSGQVAAGISMLSLSI